MGRVPPVKKDEANREASNSIIKGELEMSEKARIGARMGKQACGLEKRSFFGFFLFFS